MRYLIILLAILLLLLAACGGQPALEPTATPEPSDPVGDGVQDAQADDAEVPDRDDTDEQAPPDSDENINLGEDSDGVDTSSFLEPPVETPSVIETGVPMEARATPNEAEAEVLQEVLVTPPIPGTLVIPEDLTDEAFTVTFNKIVYLQTGGPGNTRTRIEIFPDGRYIVDGEQNFITQEQVAQLDTMLDEIHFFGMQGQFTSPDFDSDTFEYSLTVESPIGNRTVFTHDGMVPPELRSIFSTIVGYMEPNAPSRTG